MRKWTRDYVEKVFRPFFTKHLADVEKQKFSFDNVAVAIGDISKSTISRIFENLEISESIETKILDKFPIQSFSNWRNTFDCRSWIINNLVENYWLSYRFNSKRQLYVSSWLFKRDEEKVRVEKKSPKGFNFTGELSLDSNFHLCCKLTNNNILLSYQTYFPALHEETNSIDLINKKNVYEPDILIFDSLIRHGDEIYSTIEILIKEIKMPVQHHIDTYIKEKSNCVINYQHDNAFRPSNNEYLAYNFLTRYNAKSRVSIYNWNAELRHNSYYEHTIRVACPVRSIADAVEFESISASAKSVKEVLLRDLKFKGENIYFELLEYNSFEEITHPNASLIEKNLTINHTHFLVLIPKLKRKSMGIYAEIFYRIGKKLPVIVFYEDEDSLSYVLDKLKANQQIINAKFFKNAISDVAHIIEKSPEILLSFYIH